KRRGFRVLLDLAYTPDWAKANAQCVRRHPCQPDLSSWWTFVHAAIDRYTGSAFVSQDYWMGGDVAFAIWNEPDLLQFFDGGWSAYADVAITATSARDSANPAAVLVVGNMTTGAV